MSCKAPIMSRCGAAPQNRLFELVDDLHGRDAHQAIDVELVAPVAVVAAEGGERLVGLHRQDYGEVAVLDDLPGVPGVHGDPVPGVFAFEGMHGFELPPDVLVVGAAPVRRFPADDFAGGIEFRHVAARVDRLERLAKHVIVDERDHDQVQVRAVAQVAPAPFMGLPEPFDMDLLAGAVGVVRPVLEFWDILRRQG